MAIVVQTTSAKRVLVQDLLFYSNTFNHCTIVSIVVIGKISFEIAWWRERTKVSCKRKEEKWVIIRKTTVYLFSLKQQKDDAQSALTFMIIQVNKTEKCSEMFWEIQVVWHFMFRVISLSTYITLVWLWCYITR